MTCNAPSFRQHAGLENASPQYTMHKCQLCEPLTLARRRRGAAAAARPQLAQLVLQRRRRAAAQAAAALH